MVGLALPLELGIRIHLVRWTKKAKQIVVREEESVMVWVPLETNSEIKIWVQVDYLVGEPRKNWLRGCSWDREMKRVNKECIIKPATTMDNWGSYVLRSSGTQWKEFWQEFDVSSIDVVIMESFKTLLSFLIFILQFGLGLFWIIVYMGWGI